MSQPNNQPQQRPAPRPVNPEVLRLRSEAQSAEGRAFSAEELGEIKQAGQLRERARLLREQADAIVAAEK